MAAGRILAQHNKKGTAESGIGAREMVYPEVYPGGLWGPRPPQVTKGAPKKKKKEEEEKGKGKKKRGKMRGKKVRREKR